MSDPNQTIPGTYSLVKMPDGSEVMMHKLASGQWTVTEDRAKEDSQEFIARFANDDFVPAAHEPRTEGALKAPKQPGPHTKTLNHIEAYLVEVLGDPDLALYSDALALEKVKQLRSKPQLLRHVEGLIKILNNPTWNKVATMLRMPLP